VGELIYIASRRNNMQSRIRSNPLEDFFTVPEAATHLRIPARTVLWQATHGRLAGACKVGRGKRGIWLIPKAAVSCYVAPKRGRPTKVQEAPNASGS
jgi:hypothetical protein